MLIEDEIKKKPVIISKKEAIEKKLKGEVEDKSWVDVGVVNIIKKEEDSYESDSESESSSESSNIGMPSQFPKFK